MTVDKSKLTLIAPGVYQKNEKTYYIECSIMKTLHYCNKARLDTLIKKQGSIDKVGSTYISRAGKATLPKKVKPAKVKSSSDGYAPGLPKEPLTRPNPYSTFTHADALVQEEMYKNGPICLRSNIFRANKGYCNGCRWFNRCEYGAKVWASTTNQKPRITELKELKHSSINIRTENEA